MADEIAASFVRDLSGDWTGTAKLWRTSKPVKYRGDETTSFVVTSATVALFSGAETYIFPSDENGEVLDWGELPGSYQGGLSHEAAIAGLRNGDL